MSRSMRQRPRVSYAEDHVASPYATAVNPANMGLPNIHANPQFLAQQQRMLQANYLGRETSHKKQVTCDKSQDKSEKTSHETRQV